MGKNFLKKIWIKKKNLNKKFELTQGGVPGPGGCTLFWGGGCTWSWGVYLVPGGCTWSRGGVPGPRGVYLVPGGYLVRYPPHVNRMTNRCKNITLPQTSFAGGNECRDYVIDGCVLLCNNMWWSAASDWFLWEHESAALDLIDHLADTSMTDDLN